MFLNVLVRLTYKYPFFQWEYLEYEKLIQSSENKGLKSTTPKEVSTKPVSKPGPFNILCLTTGYFYL